MVTPAASISPRRMASRSAWRVAFPVGFRPAASMTFKAVQCSSTPIFLNCLGGGGTACWVGRFPCTINGTPAATAAVLPRNPLLPIASFILISYVADLEDSLQVLVRHARGG